MQENVIVFSVGNALCAPTGVLTMKLGDGVHGAPLMSNLLVTDDAKGQGIASTLIAQAEVKARESGATRLFAVSHPDNTATRELFRSLGYSEMILLEKKFSG